MPIAAERRSTRCDLRQGVSFNVSLDGSLARRTGGTGIATARSFPSFRRPLPHAVMSTLSRHFSRLLTAWPILLIGAPTLATVGSAQALGAQEAAPSLTCACAADSAQAAGLDSLRVALATATARRAEPSRARQLLNAAVLGALFGAATGATYSIIDDPPEGHEYKIPLAGAATAVGGLVLYWVIGNPFR